MDYPPKSVALVFAGGKDAALYFDHIIPLTHGAFEKATISADGSRAEVSVALDSIPKPADLCHFLPEPFKSWRKPYDVINILQMLAAGLGQELGGTIPTLTNLRTVDIAVPRAPEAFCLVPEGIVRGWISYLSSAHNDGSLSFMVGAAGGGACDVASPSVVLSNLALVDTDKCSLEHIIEFRQDVESHRKLRRLRTFVFSNYREKPLAFIEDDIQQRVDDYATAVKAWGFQTKVGVIRCILNDKLTTVIGATALCAALGGLESLALGAAVSGIAHGIGKIEVYLAEQNHTLSGLNDSNSVAYIVELRAALEGQKSDAG